MKTYSINFGMKDYGKIVLFNSRAEAVNSGNGLFLFSSEGEISEREGNWPTMQDMVNLYNHHNPSMQIKKFENKTVAARRLFSLAEAKAVAYRSTLNSIKKESSVPSDSVNEEVVKPAKNIDHANRDASVDPYETPGRKSLKFDGKRIRLASGHEKNPRRENTWGYKSMQIIIDNPGITYEEFQGKGGRPVDLRWDFKHNHVEIY